jgi:hypothetical protein
VRAYSESNEETLRTRDLLKEWAGEGFLTEAQYGLLEKETTCDLRRTNVFLRLVLALFTLIISGAVVGLFFTVFFSHAGRQTAGMFLLIFAVLSYAAAEFAVSQARLYRYGIEEGLAVCSAGFLCVGLAAFSNRGESLVPAAGALLSLWIWHRFGLPYALLAAMIFAVWIPGHWTSSRPAQHVIMAALYSVSLFLVATVRRRYRFTYLNGRFSIAEALLWLGIYLAINLQLSALDLARHWWIGLQPATEFSRPFYWTTWVLTWCLPPAVLARGLRGKDRFVTAAGILTAILTLVTNKPYLGWPRHSWDPMLLGALLIGVALFLRRWLAQGTDGVRRGFTARRLSAKDTRWMNVGATVIGLASPSPIAPSPQPGSPEVRFGGGDSGGAGATSDF